MQDLDAVLERQTARMQELRSNATANPTPAAVQALASIPRDRGETLAALGRLEEAVEDQQAAAGYLSGLVIQAGRADLLDRMTEAGDTLRATLRQLGRAEEAVEHELGEAQILLATGQQERALARLRRLFEERRAALEAEKTPERLESFVKVATVLGGALFQTERLQEALQVENDAVAAVEGFGEAQLPFLLSVRANRAVTLGSMGRAEDALAELGEVLAGWEKLLQAAPSEENLVGALRALGARADLLVDLQRTDEALRDLDRALQLAEAHLENVPGAADALRQVLRQQTQVARLHGRMDTALEAADRWVRLAQEQNRAVPSLETIEELLDAGLERALILHLVGQQEAALADANQIASGWQRLVESQPQRLDLHQRILMVLDLRERALTELGRHQEALADQGTIVEMFRALLGAGAPPDLQQALAITLQRRASTLRALGRHQEAEADLAEARKLGGLPPSLLS